MKGFLGIITFLAGPIAGVFILNVIKPGSIGWKEAFGLLSILYLLGVLMTPSEYFVRDEE